MLFDEEGYKEIELVTRCAYTGTCTIGISVHELSVEWTSLIRGNILSYFALLRSSPFFPCVCFSLQPLIPHGRVAARVLLAQLAFKLGQRPSPFKILQRRSEAALEAGDEQAGLGMEAGWSNMVHLAFVAANLVSDDVSTVTAGLFSEGEELVRSEETRRNKGLSDSESEMTCASAAAATIPVLLCSSPADHGSLALAARVLSMFKVLSRDSPAAVLTLGLSRSRIPDQGPLLFPLLRMSLFLLVRLHPCSGPAQENLLRLDALVHCLLSKEWKNTTSEEFARSEDVCIVVLVHVHAALSRLKNQALTLADEHDRTIPDPPDSDTEEAAPGFSVNQPTMRTKNALNFCRGLVGLLQNVTQERHGLLRNRLGRRLAGALVDAVGMGLESFRKCASVSSSDGRDDRGPDHGNLAQCLECLAWMDGCSLFPSMSATAVSGMHRTSALLEACMPSLKVTAVLETKVYTP